jgi:hypothetical protein
MFDFALKIGDLVGDWAGSIPALRAAAPRL